MIEQALDKYNRVRPDGEPMLSITELAEKVIDVVGKERTKSAVVSMRQTFKRIDDKKQSSISIEVLVALTTVLNTDYNTLFSYWND